MGRHLVRIDLTIDRIPLLYPPTPSISASKLSPPSSLVHSPEAARPLRLRIFTTHLESCRDHSTTRIAQLTEAWQQMGRVRAARLNREVAGSINTTGSTSSSILPDASLLCGDLNLRDSEVEKLGGLPVSVTDVWQATGQRPEAGVTWDPVRNINAASLVGSMSSGRKNQRYSSRVRACGLRFDRMYFKSAPDEPTHPVDFELKGLEKVPRAVCFPSDHWAIVGHFSLV